MYAHARGDTNSSSQSADVQQKALLTEAWPVLDKMLGVDLSCLELSHHCPMCDEWRDNIAGCKASMIQDDMGAGSC